MYRGGYEIDLTLGHRYNKIRDIQVVSTYLVVHILNPETFKSFHHCDRDAIESFSEVGSLDLTW